VLLAGALPGWENPRVLIELRAAFGDGLMIENDVDAAALAERAHGHGREVDSFAFVSVGTGIGVGLVLNGQLHRGAHGAAGEIGYMSLDEADVAAGLRPTNVADGDGDEAARAADVRSRGSLEAAASAAGIVRAANRAGIAGTLSARDVFAAAANGDPAAGRVVAGEALLIARAVSAVITVADPDLVVLGGGIGRAAGFVDAVDAYLSRILPMDCDLRVSALGEDAVVDGCLAAGTDRAWQIITAGLDGAS
jgi:predicted NBD/HSP70 family sugar kinase